MTPEIRKTLFLNGQQLQFIENKIQTYKQLMIGIIILTAIIVILNKEENAKRPK